jgi:N-formylmaleamate deformylase
VWDATASHYAKTHEVHVLTLAGFATVAPIQSEMFLETQRDAVIAYIRANKLVKPVIIGHSLGGFLAFWIAATAPDLVGPIVAVDGVPFYSALADTTMTADRARPQATAMQAMYSSFTPEQVALQTQTAVARMTRDSVGAAHIVDWARSSHVPTTAKAMAEMMTTDLRTVVSAIRSPVLLIGAGNGLSEPMQTTMKSSYASQIARIPNAKLEWFTDARHFVMLDEPARFLQVIDAFLGAK